MRRESRITSESRALLEAHDASGSFLNQQPLLGEQTQSFVEASGKPAPLPPTTHYQSTTTEPDTLIAGRYTLLEKIGEGGMGEVWVAKQTEPVKRKVAIKLIKAGMDSKAVLARFEQERQALAMMDHPNIAKVLDGGLTEDRRPFFVMELVSGLPLTKYCDEMKLTPNQRLELFVPICQAVQHAHQKGIVHRDLKPSNILITMYDGKPVPKVIDFGVAKATGGKLIEESMSTQFGAVVGTLEYMSPEQAGFSTQDIDTRADIYSLGVVLYELLTGLRPFDAKRLQKAAFDELIRILREEEPSKPSTRLSTNDSLASLAALRQIGPKKLTKLLRGELDWIIMKCLEKQRDRRYETANGLLRDIQRYLANEPVEAKPPSTRYRLRKFVYRNKAQVLAASLILFTLLGGIAGTTFGLIRAEQRRQEAEEARTKEAQQRQLADSEKQRAIEFRDKALDALRATTGDDVEKLIGEKKELGANERAYLEAIANRWLVFAQQEGMDVDSLAIQAEGNFRVAFLWHSLGRREEALRGYKKARDLYKELSDQYPLNELFQEQLSICCNDLGLVFTHLRKWQEALPELNRALQIRLSLSDRFPQKAVYQQELASTHGNLGNLFRELGEIKKARAEYEKAYALQKNLTDLFPENPFYRQDRGLGCNNLGISSWALGDYKQAICEFEQGRQIQKKLVEAFPHVPEYQHDLARTHSNLGLLLMELQRAEESLQEYQKARKLEKTLSERFPNLPQYQQHLALVHNNLATLLETLEKREEALLEYEKARDLQKTLTRLFPQSAVYQHDLSRTHYNLGNLSRQLGKIPDSLSEYERAFDLQKKLVEAFPDFPEYQRDLARTHLGKGMVFTNILKQTKTVEDFKRARVEYEQARSIQMRLTDQYPQSPEYQHDLGATHFSLGSLLGNHQRKEEALKEYQECYRIRQKLVERFSHVPEYQSHLAHLHHSTGILLQDLPNPKEARLEYEKSLTIWKQLTDRFQGVVFYQKDLALTHYDLATLLMHLGKSDESLHEYLQAREIQTKLFKQFPQDRQYRYDLARTHFGIGFLQSLRNPEEAIVEYETAREHWKNLHKRFSDPDYQISLARNHFNLGMVLVRLGKQQDARLEYENARELQLKLPKSWSDLPQHQRERASTHTNLGLLLHELKKPQEALKEIDQAGSLHQRLVKRFPDQPQYQIELGGNYCNYGLVLRDSGQLTESLSWFQQAIRILTPIHQKHPQDEKAKRFLYNCHWNRAEAYNRLEQFSEASKDWERVVELSNPEGLAWANFQLGSALFRSEDFKKAEVAFDRGLTLREQKAKGSSKDRESHWLWGMYLLDRSLVYLNPSHAERSLVWLEKTTRFLQEFQKTWPGPEVTDYLRRLHGHRAAAMNWLHRPGEAIEEIDLFLRETPPNEQINARIMRTRYLAKNGNHRDAAKTIVELLSPSSPEISNPWFLWDAALGYAQCVDAAKGDEKLQTQYTEEAIALLKRSFAAGFDDLSFMKRDPDLNPIREREDFKRIIEWVEKRRKSELLPRPKEIES